jgi:hypothetical protein
MGKYICDLEGFWKVRGVLYKVIGRQVRYYLILKHLDKGILARAWR